MLAALLNVPQTEEQWRQFWVRSSVPQALFTCAI